MTPIDDVETRESRPAAVEVDALAGPDPRLPADRPECGAGCSHLTQAEHRADWNVARSPDLKACPLCGTSRPARASRTAGRHTPAARTSFLTEVVCTVCGMAGVESAATRSTYAFRSWADGTVERIS